MNKGDVFKLVVAIVVCQLAGVIGGFFTASSVKTWYATLTKPAFNPPNWIFSPVWITLYVLMAVALFLVWRKGLQTEGVKSALLFFGMQLTLNTFWSILFFGLKMPLLAFIEIVILWDFILITVLKFKKISKPAALLLVPYLLWVSFAAVLNFFLWYLNRAAL
ncbi:MAG: tryptophan-rich sensory protein [Candidatus Aminicenantes bacterium]|jgi:tryptophan-rich sensory protein